MHTGSRDSQRQLPQGRGVFPGDDYSTSTFRKGCFDVFNSHRVSLALRPAVDAVTPLVFSRPGADRRERPVSGGNLQVPLGCPKDDRDGD